MLEYCIMFFCHSKTLENPSEKAVLYYYYGGQKLMKDSLFFKNACSRAMNYVILLSLNYIISMHVTVEAVSFCYHLECVYVKYNSHASTACSLD